MPKVDSSDVEIEDTKAQLSRIAKCLGFAPTNQKVYEGIYKCFCDKEFAENSYWDTYWRAKIASVSPRDPFQDLVDFNQRLDMENFDHHFSVEYQSAQQSYQVWIDEVADMIAVEMTEEVFDPMVRDNTIKSRLLPPELLKDRQTYRLIKEFRAITALLEEEDFLDCFPASQDEVVQQLRKTIVGLRQVGYESDYPWLATKTDEVLVKIVLDVFKGGLNEESLIMAEEGSDLYCARVLIRYMEVDFDYLAHILGQDRGALASTTDTQPVSAPAGGVLSAAGMFASAAPSSPDSEAHNTPSEDRDAAQAQTIAPS